MTGHGAIGQRLVVLFFFGVLLFNYPLLYIFNQSSDVIGIPLLYTYIFVAWALLIAAFAYVIESAP
ncbi:MAG: hypothetical protein ACR2FI_02310 [Burkholderiales bacterium]|nr:hypothetical protein [Burkholderiales bacterium]MDQ3195658.1 hypothetical protein [Pseudomonadota bacterium]